MPRTKRRDRSGAAPSYFEVHPWQSKEDYGEQGGVIGDDRGDADEQMPSQPLPPVQFRPATVTPTPEDGAGCVLFVKTTGGIVGFFADAAEHAASTRRITGKYLAVAEGAYREALDCTRDASWDLLVLCLHDATGEHVYVLAEAHGGDFMTITAPPDLTSEEMAAAAGCVGSMTLATGFGLRFECRALVNAEIDDRELVKRQVREETASSGLTDELDETTLCRLSSCSSHVVFGRIELR